jgi:hypothetical protein
MEYDAWLGARSTLRLIGDLSKVSGIKCHHALYNLPYFEAHIAFPIFCQGWTIVFYSVIPRMAFKLYGKL